MPRRYSKRSNVRRRPRRSKKGRRSYKKRYAKNNVNSLTMRAPLASRELKVKLPWTAVYDDDLEGLSSIGYVFGGNFMYPDQDPTSTLTVGCTIPAGCIEYSNFYDKYIVNGSSIKIEALSSNVDILSPMSPVIKAILIAVPFVDNGPDDNYTGVVTQLNSYSYEQLLGYPFAKWRMLGSNVGGASRLNFKMFRKTKSMCALTNLKDNQLSYGQVMPDGSDVVTGLANPQNGFFYYLRFFTVSGGTETPIPIHVTVKMSLYCTLTQREFNPVRLSVAAP